jgi:hypothetical protein
MRLKLPVFEADHSAAHLPSLGMSGALPLLFQRLHGVVLINALINIYLFWHQDSFTLLYFTLRYFVYSTYCYNLVRALL